MGNQIELLQGTLDLTDPQDTGAGANARLGNRPDASSRFHRTSSGWPGVALPGAAPPGAAGLDRFGVEHI